jgi:hypothetical protein
MLVCQHIADILRTVEQMDDSSRATTLPVAGHPALEFNASLQQAAVARAAGVAGAQQAELPAELGPLQARAAAATAAATALVEEGCFYGPDYMWSDYPKAIKDTYLREQLLATANQLKQDSAHVLFRGKELVPDNAPYAGG